MSSLTNLQRVTYTNEMIMTLIELYKFHGKEFYYKSVLKKDGERYQKNVIEKDATILVNLFKIDVSEHRIKLIVSKDATPKTNNEKLVFNIKEIVELCVKSSHEFEHTSNQVRVLADRLYKDIKRIQFVKQVSTGHDSTLEENRGLTRQDDLDIILDSFIELSTGGKDEITNLISHFYIDFTNLNPLTESNELVGTILLYVLLQRHGFTSMKYISFFEIFKDRKNEFDDAVLEANFNWKKGYANIEPLNDFIVKILLTIYEKMEGIIRDYTYNGKFGKSNSIEYTILKAPETFTREYITQRHPEVSKSTIDRTLFKLRDEGNIIAIGTGRSARWQKTNMENEDFSLEKTINLFSTFEDI